MDRDGTGLQQGRLIGPGLGPVRREPRVRGPKQARPARPAASGPRRDRSGRPSPATTSPSIRLSVSATGMTGMAAPCVRVARDDGADRPADTSGPRAVVDQHDPIVAATSRQRRRPRPPPTPAGARRQPRPRRPWPAARRRSAIAATRSAAVTITIRPTSGAASSAARVQASSGRPADVGEELVRAAHPRGAAGRDDDGVRRGRRPLNRVAAGRRSSGRRPSGGPG